MKTLNAFVLGVCLAVVVLLAVLLLWQSQQNRALQFENDRLATKIDGLNERWSAALTTFKPAVPTVETANPPPQVIQTNPPTSKEDAVAVTPSAAPASVTNVVPRPFQARTFLGDQFVGMSWVMANNVRRDAKTGKIWYDQAVLLPEESRRTFTVYVTNIVEVPAQPAQYVEQNYYVDRRPVVWWAPVAGRTKSPHKPGPPPAADVPPALDRLPPLLPPGRPTPPPSGQPGIYVPPGLR